MQLKLNDGLLIRWYAKERTDKKQNKIKAHKRFVKDKETCPLDDHSGGKGFYKLKIE